MRSVITHFLAIVAGFVAACAILSPPRDGSKSAGLFAPPAVERTYYDEAKTQVYSEAEVDRQGRYHGEMKMYHPSGRLKSTLYFSHGQTAGAAVDHDLRSDAEF